MGSNKSREAWKKKLKLGNTTKQMEKLLWEIVIRRYSGEMVTGIHQTSLTMTELST